MVPVKPAWNWIVSTPGAAFAAAIAARRLPEPLSARLVTVKVAACACGAMYEAAATAMNSAFLTMKLLAVG
jgi:hypothetical protein